ncbi:hypothetical protein [Parasitella parasitica]|uniref:Uncharacterized protein n=1 Tax=Parasitella parasitica TaxID=35722 RepID=A0A0B7N8M7_9FUNG|nr:hypothetical protein [Parasitella parasitica]
MITESHENDEIHQNHPQYIVLTGLGAGIQDFGKHQQVNQFSDALGLDLTTTMKIFSFRLIQVLYMNQMIIQYTLHFSAFMSSLGLSSSLLQIDEPKHQTKHFRQLLVVASNRHISSLLVPSAAAWSRFWTLSLTLVQRNVTYRWLHGKAYTHNVEKITSKFQIVKISLKELSKMS